jgi:hypothetical protein
MSKIICTWPMCPCLHRNDCLMDWRKPCSSVVEKQKQNERGPSKDLRTGTIGLLGDQ